MNRQTVKRNGFSLTALGEAVRGLSPFRMKHAPLFVVSEALAVVATIACIWAGGLFWLCVALLWLVLFLSRLTQAMAQAGGKAQAQRLRASRREVAAYRLKDPKSRQDYEEVASSQLQKGDLFLVSAGEQIPADGEVVLGAASVDESAITGESAPVIREADSGRCMVTGGTTLLSDWLVVRVTQENGESFLDQMIASVENIQPAAYVQDKRFYIVQSVVAVLVLLSLALTGAWQQMNGFSASSVVVMACLLACLLPTVLAALLPAADIAGGHRLMQNNVLAKDSRVLQACAKADILLLDKTGTITLGNRQAAAFVPVDGYTARELADAAQLCSLGDETSEGRSIVVLAKEQFGLRGREVRDQNLVFVPFSSAAGMSGVDYTEGEIRKGSAQAIRSYVERSGFSYSKQCVKVVEQIEQQGGTPLLVAKNHRILGVVHLKDIVQEGVREQFAALRKMGIKTIMLTGDNPVTAAAIAAEAGVDNFLADATPEGKLETIRRYQTQGHHVAMAGDTPDDAPALAQADVALAMNSGSALVKSAGNLLDLDSSPMKLAEVVRAGRQLKATRQAIYAGLSAAFVVLLFALAVPGLTGASLGLGSGFAGVCLGGLVLSLLLLCELSPIALRGLNRLSERHTGIWLFAIGGALEAAIVLKIVDMMVTLTGGR